MADLAPLDPPPASSTSATKLLLLRTARKTITDEAESLIQQTYGSEWGPLSHYSTHHHPPLFTLSTSEEVSKAHGGSGSSEDSRLEVQLEDEEEDHHSRMTSPVSWSLTGFSESNCDMLLADPTISSSFTNFLMGLGGSGGGGSAVGTSCEEACEDLISTLNLLNTQFTSTDTAYSTLPDHPTPVEGSNYASRASRRALRCPHCTYTTKSHFNLRRHTLRNHATNKDYDCPHCSYACKDAETLRSHLAFIHSEGRREYDCSQCERKFTQSSDLLRHQRLVHRGERAHGCGRCGRSFQTAQNLRRHVQRVCSAGGGGEGR